MRNSNNQTCSNSTLRPLSTLVLKHLLSLFANDFHFVTSEETPSTGIGFVTMKDRIIDYRHRLDPARI